MGVTPIGWEHRGAPEEVTVGPVSLQHGGGEDPGLSTSPPPSPPPSVGGERDEEGPSAPAETLGQPLQERGLRSRKLLSSWGQLRRSSSTLALVFQSRLCPAPGWVTRARDLPLPGPQAPCAQTGGMGWRWARTDPSGVLTAGGSWHPGSSGRLVPQASRGTRNCLMSGSGDLRPAAPSSSSLFLRLWESGQTQELG